MCILEVAKTWINATSHANKGQNVLSIYKNLGLLNATLVVATSVCSWTSFSVQPAKAVSKANSVQNSANKIRQERIDILRFRLKTAEGLRAIAENRIKNASLKLDQAEKLSQDSEMRVAALEDSAKVAETAFVAADTKFNAFLDNSNSESISKTEIIAARVEWQASYINWKAAHIQWTAALVNLTATNVHWTAAIIESKIANFELKAIEFDIENAKSSLAALGAKIFF